MFIMVTPTRTNANELHHEAAKLLERVAIKNLGEHIGD